MANIEYKSGDEKLYRNDFNPYVASKEEVEKDLKEQRKLFKNYVMNLGMFILFTSIVFIYKQ